MWQPLPLYSVFRQEAQELTIFGEIVAVDGSHPFLETSDLVGSLPARSLLKPFQLYSTGLIHAQKKQVEQRYVASTGSISATPEQVKTLKKWFEDPSFEKHFAFLALPSSMPMDESHRHHLLAQGRTPEWIYHTCFSKHMAILEACENQGWEKETYHLASHPYQQKLFSDLGEFLGYKDFHPDFVRDGCKLPTPILKLRDMAELYRLLLSREYEELTPISQMMMERPEWVGGPGRMDTELMRANPQKVVAKEGADGLLALGVAPSRQFPRGVGLVVKLSHGYDPQKSVLSILPLLQHLELNLPLEPPCDLKFHYRVPKAKKPVLDVSPLIGERLSVWPGDTAFLRTPSLSVEQGDTVSLSTVQTTLHLGAHTDAPNHFERSEVGIDGVDLDRYQGTAQVIEVHKSRNSVIKPQDIEVSLVAKRVLFKTGSFPRPEHFNEDFVALSAELIEWLSLQGVCLVGIDTPSVDPFLSKDLSAHHATYQYQMGILEGIDLSRVSAGVYHLSALPLRIEGADASPVRAILRPLAHLE